MPPVGQLAASYGAGLWAGLVVVVPPAALATLGLSAGLLAWRAGWWGVLCATWVVGLAAGGHAARRAAGDCSAVWNGGRRAAVVAVHDAPGPRGTTTARVRHAPERCGGVLRLRMAPGEVAPGVSAVVVGDYRTGGVLRVRHVRVLRTPRAVRFALRGAVAGRIESLYGRRAALVEALVLGRRDDIEPGLRNDFVAAGLAHLLAISGLHVGIIAGWLALALAGAGVHRTRWVWAAAAAWGYVGLLGFPAPATRAAGFITVHALAGLRQRHPVPGAVLAVAALMVVTLDPAAVRSVGAWLSLAAVWGTQAASGALPVRLRRMPLLRLAAVSAGAVLATAPITAAVFGSVAPAGLLSNLAAVPLAGLAVPAVMLSLAVGGPVAAGAGMVLAVIERIAALGARLPWGHVTGVPGPAFAAPWVGLLGGVLWVVRRGSLRRPAAVLAGAAAVVAVAVGAGALTERGAAGLTLHVLDVGQGDAIALRTPRGRWLLVDAGPRGPGGDAGHRRVVPYLRRHGVRTLDVLVVTHADQDHLGGVPAVVRALTPRLVLEPGQPRGSPLYLEHLAAVDAAGVDWRAARAGDVLVLDSVSVAVLHPSGGWLDRRFEANENSVVLRVSYGCFSAVLAGDAGLPAESLLAPLVGAADLLKVGHHGSAGATGAAWLDTLRPRAAVISVGRNRYGHPSPAVLDRLAARGIPVFRTDRGGTVTARTDGRYLEVIESRPTPWWGELRCRLLRWSPSSVSSSSRSACTPARRVTLPVCSTTSPSPPK